MNIHIQVFNKFSQIQTQVELLLYMLTVCLTIYRTTCFPKWMYHCIFPLAIYEGSNFSTSSPVLVIISFLLLLLPPWVFVAVCSLLIVVDYLIAEHRLQQLQFAGSRALVQQLWCMGLVALWHVESSWTRFQTHIPCNGRRILNHWTTRETLLSVFLITTIQWV